MDPEEPPNPPRAKKPPSWRWKPDGKEEAERVDDANNASDGDMLVAWACQRAFQLWKEDRYQTEAPANSDGPYPPQYPPSPAQGLVLLPGTEGFVKDVKG